jgi:hypothetical protein
MTSRTVSHDRGDHIEVVVCRDGEEVSRTTKPKKNLPTRKPPLGDALESFLTSYGITTTTQLTETQWLHQCRNCDWTLEADSPDEVIHVCGKPEVVRIGDQIKAGLEHIGVVQADVEKLLAKIGLPCGCDGRRRFLNGLDEAVGLGEKINAFKAFMKWG